MSFEKDDWAISSFSPSRIMILSKHDAILRNKKKERAKRPQDEKEEKKETFPTYS